MITPEEVRRKAENLYPKFLRAWLEDKSLFPKDIPSEKRLDDDVAAAARSVRRLLEGSKNELGYGYSVELREVNSPKYGRNPFPRRIWFETEEDLLRFIGKPKEFDRFVNAVTKVRARYPQLETWIRSNPARMIKAAEHVDGLLQVIDFLRDNPRSGKLVRALPLPLDTKFIERHKGILMKWLDATLPPGTIRADEENFERRFGLRLAERHFPVRFLDSVLQRECDCPWADFSIPLTDLAELPVSNARVMVVENKISLLMLPSLPRTVALGGLGDSVTNLWEVGWLAECPLQYWGDLDTAGLGMLARLRRLFPQTKSLLMDVETLLQWRDRIAEDRTEKPREPPLGLTDGEQAAFRMCVEEGLRIEQERFPQAFVNDVLRER